MNYQAVKPACQVGAQKIVLARQAGLSYHPGMKTKQAVKLAGSQAALARVLSVTRQAVAQWGLTLPPLRLYQLRERRPGWFK